MIGIPDGTEEEQGIENVFEKVMMENFPNLMSLLLTLNPPSGLCWSSWMLQAEGVGISFFPFLVVLGIRERGFLSLGYNIHRCPAFCPSF